MNVPQLKILKGKDVPLDGLVGKRISIIGYGNQGRAHALNLKESGLHVTIGTRNIEKAEKDGFTVSTIEEAAAADLVIIALPDEVQGKVFSSQIEPNLQEDTTLGFIHGFSIHYAHINPAIGVGVVMVAPKGPGVTLRNRFQTGSGIPALFAVHQENSQNTARSIALGWAAGIGSSRVGVIESTFRDETETDLFGEQSIVVGGLVALIKTAYETLVEAGYPPQLAYIECCHEVKQVADIVHEQGIAKMMEAISSTAEMGAYEAIELLDDAHLRTHFNTLLNNIQNGTFAKRLSSDAAQDKRELLQTHEIEEIGKEIRSLMFPDDD